MNLSFFESKDIANLYPLALTRPAADLRCGILTVAEKWAWDLKTKSFGFETSTHWSTALSGMSEHSHSREYLSEKFPSLVHGNTHATIDIYINGHVLPNADLVAAVSRLTAGQSLWSSDMLIALKTGTSDSNTFPIQWNGTCSIITRPYHIFQFNGAEILADFERITAGRNSQVVNESNRQFGGHPVFVEEGAKVNFATLNSNEGPIYIGKNAEIMEGSLVRGPFALCEGAVLKMGTKAYSNSTLGPYSVAGGEISNVVFWGYSNKGHDGFLGNAVLGEWCNIGADTNASNLKNTYEDVKVWNYSSKRFEKSGMQFCGLIMGDHSKCGINTMFNTGTVVGVACNLFGAGFPRNFVADFSWGGAQGIVSHQLSAVDKTASLVMPRRKREYSEIEKSILHHIFEEWGIKE